MADPAAALLWVDRFGEVKQDEADYRAVWENT